MRATLHVPVPSSSLLRYLKIQSEDCYFFTANPRGFNHGSPRQTQLHAACNVGALSSLSSHIWTPIPRPATCEANLLNLDFLFPRLASPRSQFSTANPRQRARDIRRRTEQSITGSRYASDGRGSGWLRRIFSGKTNRRRPLKGIDVAYDEGTDASMYTLGRTMSAKAANEQKLRCTEFDENGNVVLVNGEFKKSELIAKVWPPSRKSCRTMLTD